MPYREFTLSKAKKEFQLTIQENVRFLPTIAPVAPSARLLDDLEDVPWAIAVGSEKARSESIIYPVLQEVRRICDRPYSSKAIAPRSPAFLKMPGIFSSATLKSTWGLCGSASFMIKGLHGATMEWPEIVSTLK
jgi:hypothetical protein